MSGGLVIRRAKEADARQIVEAHHAAVREKAIKAYAPEIIAAWAPSEISDARVQKLAEQIASGEFFTLVAETDGKIFGFGQVTPGKNVLGAVYVAKNAFGGVGERLIKQLIQHARDKNCKFLAMDASTNSEAFYRRNGFKVMGYGKHRITSVGLDMDCVHMMLKLE